MEQTVVRATLGRPTGSRPSRRLRAEGKLPGVVYGLGKDPQTVTVEYAALRAALNGVAGMNAVFTLDVEGAAETVLVRSVQRDPIKRVVTHADFLRVDLDRTVRVKVPIELVGDDSGVTDHGGLIEQKLFELEVEVAPDRIPQRIQADVSIMTLDRGLSVADLVVPDGVISLIEDDVSVVTPVISRAAKVGAGDEAEGLEGLEEAEGEAGEAEEADGADEAAAEDEG